MKYWIEELKYDWCKWNISEPVLIKSSKAHDITKTIFLNRENHILQIITPSFNYEKRFSSSQRHHHHLAANKLNTEFSILIYIYINLFEFQAWNFSIIYDARYCYKRETDRKSEQTKYFLGFLYLILIDWILLP